jgi:cytochrome subunit of sulfide dehydrogenase
VKDVSVTPTTKTQRSPFACRGRPVNARTFVQNLPVLLALLAMSGARAESSAVEARDAAASCRSCHAAASVATAIPSLDGLSRAEIATRMFAFRDGQRSGTVMPQLARGYSEAQIDAIAAAFASNSR